MLRTWNFAVILTLKLTGVSNWSPQLLSVISLVSGKKERKMTLTLENHPYIRQPFQELMKHFQASVGQTRWLFFINQGLPNSLHNVLQLSQFILVYAKKFKSLSIYVCLFPHCILLFLNWVSLVLLVFFSQQILIIVLFCEVFFTIEIEKSITLPCMKLRMTGISLRVWCRTLRT